MAEFFVGIMLPDDFAAEVECWRRRFAAPRTAPHITLLPPFQWPGSDEEIIKAISSCLEDISPFLLRTSGLGSFGRRVIYVGVELTAELQHLYERLIAKFAELGVGDLSQGRAYHPHITLATRLSPERYQVYREELSGYSPVRQFICREITLFKMQVQGRRRHWLVHRKIPLA